MGVAQIRSSIQDANEVENFEETQDQLKYIAKYKRSRQLKRLNFQ